MSEGHLYSQTTFYQRNIQCVNREKEGKRKKETQKEKQSSQNPLVTLPLNQF